MNSNDNQLYDICVLGSKNCGKSSLILGYINDHYESGFSENEEVYTKIIRKDGNYTEISILDTNSNQDNYSTSRKIQLINNSAIIFAYAIDDKNSFFEMMELYDRVNNIRDILPPLTVVGLKCDLEDERQVEYEEGEDFASSINAMAFVETSFITGVNIEDGFQPLVDIIMQHKIEHRRKSTTLRSHEISSFQSLREILNTPTLTDEDMRNPRSPNDSNLSPITSLTTARELNFENMNIEIPNFKSNSFTEISKRSDIEEVAPDVREVVPDVVANPSDTEKLNTTKGETKPTRTQKPSQKPSHNPQSGCCVIV